MMPRSIFYILAVLVALSLIPVGLIYKASQSRKDRPRIQVVYDMDQQVKYKTQTESGFFEDGVSMRGLPEGTVARGLLRESDPVYLGMETLTAGGDTVYVQDIPVPVTPALMERGQQRYDIFCATCHAPSGNGQSLVHLRAQGLAEGTWSPPTDLTSETVVAREAGHIFNTITHGIRNMPGYASQIKPEDRWAIVAYVRALQLSRTATIDDVPEDVRRELTAQGSSE
jgi:mono/diheme cytochrome c family protein